MDELRDREEIESKVEKLEDLEIDILEMDEQVEPHELRDLASTIETLHWVLGNRADTPWG